MDNQPYKKLRRKYIIAIVAMIVLMAVGLLFDLNKPDLITKDCKKHLDSIDIKNACWDVLINTARVTNLLDSKVDYEIIVVDYTGCKGVYSFSDILNNQSLVDSEAQKIFKNLIDKKAFKKIELRFHSNSTHSNSQIFTYSINGDVLELEEKSKTQPLVQKPTYNTRLASAG